MKQFRTTIELDMPSISSIKPSSILSDLCEEMAALWAAQLFWQALAQLQYTICDIATRHAFLPPNQYNAYLTKLKSTEFAEHIAGWTVIEWRAAIEESPYALLLAVDACCAVADPALTPSGDDVLYPRSFYEPGFTQAAVRGNLGCQGVVEEIRVYVVRFDHLGLATSQGGSRHHYTPHYWCFPEVRDGYKREVRPLRHVAMIDAMQALVKKRKQLKVALVELPEVVHLASPKPQSFVENRWLSMGLPPAVDTKIQHAAKLAIRQARIQGAHIVLFGELCGSEGVTAALISELGSTDRHDNPMLVVGPTRHEIAADGTARNMCRVLDADGNYLDDLTHQKINWVSLARLLADDAPLEEAITPGHGVSLLATPFGLIAIVICHDLSQAIENHTLINVLGDLPLFMLLVPSMSEKTDAHKRAARNVGLESGAHILVANQALVKFWEGDTTEWEEGGSFWQQGRSTNPLSVEVFRYRIIETAGSMRVQVDAADLVNPKLVNPKSAIALNK